LEINKKEELIPFGMEYLRYGEGGKGCKSKTVRGGRLGPVVCVRMFVCVRMYMCARVAFLCMIRTGSSLMRVHAIT